MRKLFGPFTMLMIFAGGLLLGTAAYYGIFENPGISLRGNWAPAIRGFTGAALVFLGLVIRRVAATWRADEHFRGKARRVGLAVARTPLSIAAYVGFAAAICGFITFLQVERFERGAGTAWAGVALCGFITHYAARYLLRWVREAEGPPPPTETVRVYDE